MSFRFRLQRVLELREESEQARARTLAAATDQASECKRQQDAMQSLRELQRESLQAAARGVITAGELHHLTFIIGQLDDRLARANDDVEEAERIVSVAQAALHLASRDRRVIGRLKERHAERWYDAEQQRDRMHMDEIALSRFTQARSMRTGTDMNAADASTEPLVIDRSLTPPASPVI